MIGLSEIGKGLIKVGQGFVALADKLVDFGRDILAFAKKVVEVGQRIGNDILAWVGENLFKIDLLKLSGSLDSDFNACVGLEVECVIFGIEIDYKGMKLFFVTEPLNIAISKFWVATPSPKVES